MPQGNDTLKKVWEHWARICGQLSLWPDALPVIAGVPPVEALEQPKQHPSLGEEEKWKGTETWEVEHSRSFCFKSTVFQSVSTFFVRRNLYLND